MFKIRLLCIGLASCLLLSSCNWFGNTVSDVESDLSEGMSDIGSGLSEGMSDLTHDGNSQSSTPDSNRSSDILDHDDSSRDLNNSEGTPSSGVPSESDHTAELEVGVSNVNVTPVDLTALDNKKQGWGQGVQMDDKNRPLSSLSYQDKYAQYDAYFIGADEKIIYLTFDCGYENGYTPPILDTLKEKDVPAVFFCTLDYIKAEPDLIQRMIDEGHAIGNHSDKHPSFPDVSMERREQELKNVETHMLDQFNYQMTLFRAPAGEFSDQVLAQAQQLGYKTLFWSYAYKDWETNNQMGPDKALPKLEKALHNGAIYLLHAVSSDNAAILGDFIDYARQQGYEFRLFT
jgi:peptidoglycan-N-acetylmuramic acid deacetylase